MSWRSKLFHKCRVLMHFYLFYSLIDWCLNVGIIRILFRIWCYFTRVLWSRELIHIISVIKYHLKQHLTTASMLVWPQNFKPRLYSKLWFDLQLYLYFSKKMVLRIICSTKGGTYANIFMKCVKVSNSLLCWKGKY